MKLCYGIRVCRFIGTETSSKPNKGLHTSPVQVRYPKFERRNALAEAVPKCIGILVDIVMLCSQRLDLLLTQQLLNGHFFGESTFVAC